MIWSISASVAPAALNSADFSGASGPEAVRMRVVAFPGDVVHADVAGS